MRLRSMSALLVAAGATSAHASVTHVFEDFSTHTAGGPGQYYLNGRVPSVSTNGAAWQEMGWGNWAFVSATGSPANNFGVLWGGSTIGAAAIDIRTPGQEVGRFVTISSKMALGAPGYGVASHDARQGGGVRLGFWSGVGQHNWDLFSGLVMDSAGRLNTVSDTTWDGGGEGWALGTAVAFAGGAFNQYQLRTLSMTVDTTLGTITNISLEGSSADYSSLYGTQVFTVGNTKYAGVAQQFDYNYSASSFDDFTVSSVPAPGAIALLGLAGLAGRRRR